jgi:intraflagellar transport protein 172
MYARNGEWDRCLDLAEKSAPKALPHYLTQHCKVLAKDEDFLGACRAFVRYGAPRDPGNYPLYKLICSELCSKKFPTSSEETTMWISLREMLLRVVAGTQVPPPAYNKIDKEVAEFTKSFMVAHLCALRAQARDRGISANIMMKQSVACSGTLPISQLIARSTTLVSLAVTLRFRSPTLRSSTSTASSISAMQLRIRIARRSTILIS